MSYILDALRRADAERERGRVPGLHTQVPPSRAADGPGRSGAPRPAWRRWAVVAIGLMALAGAGVWWTRGDAPAEGSLAPAPAPATTPVAAVPPPPAAAPQATEPGAPRVAAPMPAAPVQPILAPAPPPPAAPPAPRPTAPGAAAAPAPSAGPAAAPAPAVAAAPAAKAGGPADDALPRVADLAPPARSALPTLQVSGATYASNPALRMLIVDGKVLQEGQDIAPGLKLETIGPRAAVINHQGQRLRLTY